MKANFKSGLTVNRTIHVDKGRTVTFTHPTTSVALRVYATPALVEDIEATCRDLILAHADRGEDSVGAGIDVRHKAPTLLDQDVTITAEVTKVDGRAVSFAVTATDGIDTICRCTHDRHVIDIGQLADRLAAKAEKVRG